MFPVFLRLGPLTLHTYGLLVALGFVSGLYLVRQEMDRLKIAPDLVDQLVLIATVAGIFGARLFYFFSWDVSILWTDPLQFFKVWEGGLVYYGAFVFGVLGAWAYCRYRKVSFVTFCDIFAAPMLLAQSIGRLGCFAAGCCYGKPTRSFLGVTFTHPESLAPTFVSLHPTQIYSSVSLFLLFIGVYLMSKDRPRKGVLASIYLLGYGTLRFVIEFIRNDYRGPVAGGLQPSQWISLVAIVLGSVFLVNIYKSQSEAKP